MVGNQGDADTWRYLQLVAVELHWLGQQVAQFFRHAADLVEHR